MKPLITAALLIISLPLTAQASSSEWLNYPGGDIRIVTTGRPDSQGHLRGALQINLKPGWKTYWKNPGASGIPPEIIPMNDLLQVDIQFPAPKLMKEISGNWAGYDSSLSLPIVFHVNNPQLSPIIDVQIHLGLCETICIPVSGSLNFDSGADEENFSDAVLVRTAFGALPESPRDDFSVREVSLINDQLIIHAKTPDDSLEPALFLAYKDGSFIEMPQLQGLTEDGLSKYIYKFISKLQQSPHELQYTLVQGDNAVAGILNLPVDINP